MNENTLYADFKTTLFSISAVAVAVLFAALVSSDPGAIVIVFCTGFVGYLLGRTASSWRSLSTNSILAEITAAHEATMEHQLRISEIHATSRELAAMTDLYQQRIINIQEQLSLSDSAIDDRIAELIAHEIKVRGIEVKFPQEHEGRSEGISTS